MIFIKSDGATVIEDLVGRIFGRLRVFADSGKRQNYGVMWTCICICGRFKDVREDHLKAGRIRSCGCLQREQARIHLKKVMEKKKAEKHSRFSHGGTGTKLHDIWRGMKSRCYNPNSSRYEYFGAKGIRICIEWRHSFFEFRRWALANNYKEGLSIDRIKKGEGYSPGNCQWITKSEHSKKTRKEQ